MIDINLCPNIMNCNKNLFHELQMYFIILFLVQILL